MKLPFRSLATSILLHCIKMHSCSVAFHKTLACYLTASTSFVSWIKVRGVKNAVSGLRVNHKKVSLVLFLTKTFLIKISFTQVCNQSRRACLISPEDPILTLPMQISAPSQKILSSGKYEAYCAFPEEACFAKSLRWSSSPTISGFLRSFLRFVKSF